MTVKLVPFVWEGLKFEHRPATSLQDRVEEYLVSVTPMPLCNFNLEIEISWCERNRQYQATAGLEGDSNKFEHVDVVTPYENWIGYSSFSPQAALQAMRKTISKHMLEADEFAQLLTVALSMIPEEQPALVRPIALDPPDSEEGGI